MSRFRRATIERGYGRNRQRRGGAVHSSSVAEKRKTVTIVFLDVAGSTSLAERLDQEAMRRVMERYFEEMRSVLERHGGTVEKFIGDAVMAAFGIPAAHEDASGGAGPVTLRGQRRLSRSTDRSEELSLRFREPRRVFSRTGARACWSGPWAAGQSSYSGQGSQS